MNSTSLVETSFESHDGTQTREIGVHLGRLLRGGDVVELIGDLGSGKTTMAQGMVAGLGGPRRVTSPTFTLVNEYEGHNHLRILHVDAYRLGELDAAEFLVDTLGLQEWAGLEDTVMLIEWADRTAKFLPADCLRIALVRGKKDDAREITVRGGAKWKPILASLMETIRATE
jgi:tRNA threonylcarbamoyladenosine biosynthesis protein TsaE